MNTTIAILRNQFDNATKHNFKRMLIASADHYDKLQQAASTNATIDTYYQAALPAYQEFRDCYQQITSNFALYQGQTQLFEERIMELRSTLIRKWDVNIQMEYDEMSAFYKMLLPNGRSPFQSGAYELRLNAVKSLVMSLKGMNNPTLLVLAQNIENWLIDTQAIRTKQQGLESIDTQLRQKVEDLRVRLAKAMHLVFFQLCVYHYDNLIEVEAYYEWKYFSTNSDKSTSNNATTPPITVVVNSDQRVTVIDDNFQASDEILLKNEGNIPLYAWISSVENGAMPNDVSVIQGGADIIYQHSELSDGSTPQRYLLVENKDNTNDGKITVQRL